MLKRFILNFLLVIGLASGQAAFIYGLPDPFNNLNLVVVVSVFILVFKGFGPAFWLAIGSGVLLDFYSFQSFGANLAGLAAAVAVANFFLVNFLTNRSLYSLLSLTILAGAAHKAFLILYNFIARSFGSADFALPPVLSFFLNELKGAFLNIICVALLFYLASFISSRFKPVFLKPQ